jgi:hypothetical protein
MMNLYGMEDVMKKRTEGVRFNDTSRTSDLIKRVSADDREWFVRNPTKTFRVRDYVCGEFDSACEAVDDSSIGFVVVLKHGEHVRIREAVRLPNELRHFVRDAHRHLGRTSIHFDPATPKELLLQTTDRFDIGTFIPSFISQEPETVH